ncbi:MAG: Uma2 family endonuclease [Chloroflexi bacterium CFX4]|nr:Uma2 family endonuclease [Chloroflexi bacterium CFX4]MDL1922290.1 Uma2 family endonuclease [Chloroflexi bacterium CFX3]
MSLQRVKLTATEFAAICALSANHARRLELYEGDIYEMAPSSQLASVITWRLSSFLSVHVLRADLGIMHSPEGGIRFAENTVLAPDIAFIPKERITGIQAARFATDLPALVVEVVSPSDSHAQVREKAARYLRFGVAMVWIVFPKARTLEQHTLLDDQVRIVTLGEADRLEGGSILPDFSLPLREVFDVGYPITEETEEES